MKVRSRYTSIEFQEDDVTRLPTVPPSAIWQGTAYELERYLPVLPVEMPEYFSFLPSSPSIDELDTLPPGGERLQNERSLVHAASVESAQRDDKNDRSRGQIDRAHIREADICELVTNPPPLQFQPRSVLALGNEPSYIDTVVEADTVMDDTLIIVPALSSNIESYPTRVEDAVDVALTVRARQLLSGNCFQEDQPAFISKPLDYMRWWLLRPGRLEFLFWLGSAVLLSVIMCVVLVMMGLGLGWMSFGHSVH